MTAVRPPRSLLDIIRRRSLVMALVAVPIVLGGLAFTMRAPSVYAADAVLSVNPKGELGSDFLKLSLPRYGVLATSDGMVERVAASTGRPPSELEKNVQVEVPVDSATVRITVRDSDAARAAAAANMIADELADPLSATDLLSEATVLRRAVAPKVPVAPRKAINALAALMAAGLAAMATAIAFEMARPEIGTADELAAITGVPVVANFGDDRLRALIRRRSARKGLPHVASPNGLVGLRSFVNALSNGPARCVRPLARAAAGPFAHDPDLSRDRVPAANEPGESAPTIVVLTAPSAGRYRTQVSLRLAESLAERGRRVLIVDADPVHMGVAEQIEGVGRRRTRKAASAQTSSSSSNESGVSEVRRGLDLLRSSSDGADPLFARQLVHQIDMLSANYDVVIVDAAPLSADHGTEELASVASATLVVVPRDIGSAAVARAMNALSSASVGAAGIVSVGFPESISGSNAGVR